MVLAYLRKILQRPGFQPDIMLLNCGLHDIKTSAETRQKQVSIEKLSPKSFRYIQSFNQKSNQSGMGKNHSGS